MQHCSYPALLLIFPQGMLKSPLSVNHYDVYQECMKNTACRCALDCQKASHGMPLCLGHPLNRHGLHEFRLHPLLRLRVLVQA